MYLYNIHSLLPEQIILTHLSTLYNLFLILQTSSFWFLVFLFKTTPFPSYLALGKACLKRCVICLVEIPEGHYRKNVGEAIYEEIKE